MNGGRVIAGMCGKEAQARGRVQAQPGVLADCLLAAKKCRLERVRWLSHKSAASGGKCDCCHHGHGGEEAKS